MADEPLLDDTIEGIVEMVEAAEVLGRAMNCTTPQAVRWMLKSAQTMQGLKKPNSFLSMPVASKPQ